MTESRTLVVVNPDGLHARPAALLAGALHGLDAAVTIENPRTGKPAVAITGPTSILLLAARKGDELLATAEGADARAALDALAALLRAGFGEPVDDAPPSRPSTGPLGVSPGRAVAPAVHMPQPIAEPPAGTPSADDAARIDTAMRAVAAQLHERAARVTGEAREILEAGALMATDPGLLERITALREHGAERAVWLAVSEFADALGEQGGRMAERVSDLHDLRNRIVASLLGRPAPGVPDRSDPYVLIARDLAPADTALLDPARCVALVTEQGGPTSHTAILARSLGIPAIVGAAGALEIAEGTVLLVDGSTGALTQNPSAAQTAAVENAAVAVFSGAGVTKDGHRIRLLANIGSPESITGALEAKAEGIGLFRTEFCFMDRASAPTVDEQVAAYRPVFAAFPGRAVVVRTLDAGADKPLAFVTDEEQNPALGMRGIRTAWRDPQLLDDQLRAIALAAAAERAIVSVMAPMVATVDEAEQFALACARHGIARSGVMIETPAAALLAPEITAAVTFTSIGTNDLAQYAMAADRLIGDLAHLNDPWQPAVLRLIQLSVNAAAAAGRPIGVCGEAAADPMLAAVLVGLRIGSLSMSPRSIAAVGAMLATLTRDQCERAARAAIGSPTAARARQSAISLLG